MISSDKMSFTMDKIEFGQWLQAEREKRDWSQSDLARLSGLHRQIINKTENGVSMPAVETYIALAKAFDLSPMYLLRKAGLLPPGNDVSGLQDWEYLLAQLPQDEQDEVRQIALMKIEKRQKAEAAARASQFKPGKQNG
jgi:transcriptional regulator with XRE-family HTH domain